MRNGAQQICFHLRRFFFGFQRLLPFQFYGKSAGHNGNGNHNQRGNAVFLNCEINFEKRKGKREINRNNAYQRGNDSVNIPIGQN